MAVNGGLGTDGFLRALEGACQELGARRQQVNDLNVFPVPDGDTGTNMHLTLEAALAEARRAYRPGAPLGEVARAAARGSLWGARGNSGVILSQLLRGWAAAVEGRESASPSRVAYAFQRAAETAYRAVVEPVEGTLLTVGKAAAAAAQKAVEQGAGLVGVLQAALEGARVALEKTPEQLPVLKKAGVVDAGGMGFVAILEGAMEALGASPGDASPLVGQLGGRVEALGGQGPAAVLTAARPGLGGPGASLPGVGPDGALGTPGGAPEAGAGAPEGTGPGGGPLKYIYCTEFIITGEGVSEDRLRERLESLGDSLLVVGDGDTWKVHIHTNRPGQALEVAVDFGQLESVHVANMARQVQEKQAREQGQPVDGLPTGDPGSAGLVAVVPGEGLAGIFRSLGATGIVFGGQTMNPSTQEIADALRGEEAETVFLLPNNGNVLFAARQAAQLVPGKRVVVIPSKTVPQGVAAALAFSPEGTGDGGADGGWDALARAMEAAMGTVRSGEVVQAVRDFQGEGRQVEAGEFIGLEGGAVRVAGHDRDEVALALVASLGGGEAEAVTVYYGDGVSADEAERLAGALRHRFPQAEVDVYEGGQPHYPYLLSVE